MRDKKRTTVCFKPSAYLALRLEAAASDRSISDVVNDAVKVALAEDFEDLDAFVRRRSERSVSLDSLVGGWKG